MVMMPVVVMSAMEAAVVMMGATLETAAVMMMPSTTVPAPAVGVGGRGKR